MNYSSVLATVSITGASASKSFFMSAEENQTDYILRWSWFIFMNHILVVTCLISLWEMVQTISNQSSRCRWLAQD